MLHRIIEGHPYSGTFFSEENEGDEGISDAIVVIQPPIDLTQAKGVIDSMAVPGVRFEPYATTATKAVIELTLQSGTHTHERKVETMFVSAKAVITRLNEIEAGTFPERG